MIETISLSAKVGIAVLILAPLIQLAVEAVLDLPIAPNRYLLILVMVMAAIPLVFFVIEYRLSRPLGTGLKILTGILTPVVLVTLLVAVVRLTPGPWGPIPGGPLSGEVSDELYPDWRLAETEKYIHLQVQADNGRVRSLEMLCLLYEDALYVGANYPESKQWPADVATNPHVVIKLGSVLYRRLARRADEALEGTLLEAMNDKYGFDVSLGTGVVWFYRLDPVG